MGVYNDITETIGRTPLVKLNRVVKPDQANVMTKLEFFNPTSCVKERIALRMLDQAVEDGLLKPGGLIVEPTSGNTGIGLVTVAAARGYRLIITMPESMSIERRKVLTHLGAELVLTPADKGMRGAIERAEEIYNATPGAFMPQQFNNPANVAAHYETTGPEIWEDTEGTVDVFVAGVGTGGTVTGVGKYLKEKNPNVKIVAVEPAESPVLGGGKPGPHKIQGIGAGFIPSIVDLSVIDQIEQVTTEEAIETAKQLARHEGIFCGISCGAAAAVALRLAAQEEYKGKNIVVVLPDTGERYLSTALFAD